VRVHDVKTRKKKRNPLVWVQPGEGKKHGGRQGRGRFRGCPQDPREAGQQLRKECWGERSGYASEARFLEGATATIQRRGNQGQERCGGEYWLSPMASGFGTTSLSPQSTLMSMLKSPPGEHTLGQATGS
jgi:hypothetical protein